jgi:hypothetical protein
MSSHRRVRLAVSSADGEPRSLRDVVVKVYRDGLDPAGFEIQIIDMPASPATALSIASTTSTPPFSEGGTDVGEAPDEGVER